MSFFICRNIFYNSSHVKKYYHFDASKTKYKIEDLDEVDKSIYLALQSQN